MTTPSVQVSSTSLGGFVSALQGSPVNVALGETLTFRLADTSGVTSWSLSIYGLDDTVIAPALTIVGATFTCTAPATPTTGWSLIFQSKVNGGKDSTGATSPALTTTFKIAKPTAGGVRVLAANETVEESSTSGWTGPFNGVLRAPGGAPSGSASGALTLTFPAPGINLAAGATYVTGSLPPASGGVVNARVVATANQPLTGTVATIDGVTIVSGTDKILCVAQTTATQNGVYLYNSAGAWTRAPELSASGNFIAGLKVHIYDGSLNQHSDWYLQTTGAVTLGTTALNFQLGDSVINVRRFGALGNGGDDTTALLAAVAALPLTSGGTLFFPPGVYRHSSPILIGNLGTVGQRISIVGNAANLAFFGAGGPQLRVVNTSQVRVEGINFDGGGTADSNVQFFDPGGGTVIDDASVEYCQFINSRVAAVMSGGNEVQPTVAASVFTSALHGFANNMLVQVVKVFGNLPSPLVNSVAYYVVNATTNTFQISLTNGGAPITITTAGDGVWTVGNIVGGEVLYLNLNHCRMIQPNAAGAKRQIWQIRQKSDNSVGLKVENSTSSGGLFGIGTTFTANSGTNVITITQSYANGDQVRFAAAIGATLPSGITSDTPYWVINVTGTTMQISATQGGSVLALVTNGSGTLRCWQVLGPYYALGIQGGTALLSNFISAGHIATVWGDGTPGSQGFGLCCRGLEAQDWSLADLDMSHRGGAPFGQRPIVFEGVSHSDISGGSSRCIFFDAQGYEPLVLIGVRADRDINCVALMHVNVNGLQFSSALVPATGLTGKLIGAANYRGNWEENGGGGYLSRLGTTTIYGSLTTAAATDLTLNPTTGVHHLQKAGTDGLVTSILPNSIVKFLGTSVTVANGASLTLGTDAFKGWLIVSDTGGTGAVFLLSGAGVATTKSLDPYGLYSGVFNTAGLFNIYTSGGNLILQNLRGSSNSFNFYLFAGA